MTLEYRPLVDDDLEQAVIVESTAFYNKPTPDRLDQLREFFPPDWTVGAFVDGRLVADVRTIPMARRINGSATPFGAIGPVACLSAYRRQGHVGKLLRLTLERMREQGTPLSGLFTPHDALYARFGWERSEARKQYYLRPSDIRLRVKGAPGVIESVAPDDWGRLDAIYRRYAGPRNGPLHRVEPWWRQNVLRHYDETTAGLGDNDAFVWKNANGDDEGYVSYHSRAMPRTDRYAPWEVLVRDFVSLSGDAYLGLWQHLLAHDIATRLAVHMPVDDPFADLVEDPRKVELPRAEGPMIRVVDLERVLSRRPFVGSRPASFTMRVTDPSASWNEGVWRIDAGEGQVQIERNNGDADVELNAGTLAPLYTGFMRPDVAAGVGLLKVNRAKALEDMRDVFAVTHPPYSNDWY